MAYEKKANFKRPSNIDVEGLLILDGNAGRQQYDVTNAVDKLCSLEEAGAFSVLCIPVYMYNADVTGDSNKKGTRVVGFIETVTPTGDDSIVINAKIYPTYKDAVEKLIDPIFHARIAAHNGEATRFIQIEYVSSSRYEGDNA